MWDMTMVLHATVVTLVYDDSSKITVVKYIFKVRFDDGLPLNCRRIPFLTTVY